jgi:hypothetical protein
MLPRCCWPLADVGVASATGKCCFPAARSNGGVTADRGERRQSLHACAANCNLGGEPSSDCGASSWSVEIEVTGSKLVL